MVTADLKNLVVTTPLNGEERYRTALSSCLREALSHRKGHQFVLRPMSDEDWASHPADLAHIVEALSYEETDDRLGNPWKHGMGLLRDVRERTEHDQTGHLLAGGEIDGHGSTEVASQRQRSGRDGRAGSR